MIEETNTSYLEIKQSGKIKEKHSGKEINQEFKYRIYYSENAEEEAKVLNTIKNIISDGVKIQGDEEDNPPKNLATTI